MENNDNDGYTPFLLAAVKGHVEASMLLLERGANISAQEKLGRNAVYLCAEENETTLLRVSRPCLCV